MNDYRPSVLIVDDEPRIVRALNRLLNPHFETHLVGSGELALEVLRSRRVHVIISDQRMPRMTGVELLAKVKMISPNTTRILLTGYSDVSAIMDSVNQGEIFRYITKPWRNSDILETVQQASEISNSLYLKSSDRRRSQQEMLVRDKKKVLVMDKGGELLQMISKVLDHRVECYAVEKVRSASKIIVAKNINLIVMNVSLNDKEALAFIKTAKTLKPGILCLVAADSADITHIMSLINEGQIYRFIKKPLKAGQLKMYLISAIRYYNQLITYPELLARHAVDNISNEEERKYAAIFNRMWRFLLRAYHRFAT